MKTPFYICFLLLLATCQTRPPDQTKSVQSPAASFSVTTFPLKWTEKPIDQATQAVEEKKDEKEFRVLIDKFRCLPHSFSDNRKLLSLTCVDSSAHDNNEA